MYNFWKKHHNAIFLVLLILVAGLAIMKQQKVEKQPKTAHIATSFYPLAEFARHVAGDHMKVEALTPSGVEPHDYEPTAQDIITIRSSSLFIYNGNGVDSWAEKLSSDLASNHVTLLNMTKTLNTKSKDPHYWLDPVLAKQMVMAIKNNLIQLDPANASSYEANTKNYLNELTILDTELRQGLTNCASREIIVSHAAFGYFSKRYNLTETTIAGLSPDDEPSPKRLAEVATYARDHHVTHIFFESLVSPKLSQTIATEIGAKTSVLNPVEGLSTEQIESGYNYVSLMKQNLTNLREALSCQ